MTRRKLPTGIQTFRVIREDDCYYVDKTAFILRLAREGKHYIDLTLEPEFGYTEADLDAVFASAQEP